MAFSKFIFGETLEQALEAIPEDCQLKFYRMVKDYGLHGIEPDLKGFELATWVQMKAMIDITMPKKNNASPVSKVGAPFGNKNAQKTIKNNSDNQINSDNCNELFLINNSETIKNNLFNCLNDNENVNVNGDGNSIKQPPLFLIKTKIKEQGFFLDDDPLLERLIAETDPTWFEGRHTFVDFIARKVQREYGDKPKDEQHRVFRKLLFDAPNLREEYPRWRRQQENIDGFRAAKEAVEAAKENHPETCGNCGTVLRQWDGMWVCYSCHAQYSFNEGNREWDYHGPPTRGLSEGFREEINKGVKHGTVVP